ncbi:MAG: hypothetical protein R3D69_06680 [Xanthobacteraceae bacterium]
MKLFAVLIAAAIASLVSFTGARADDFPSRPISWVVGFAPGGISDQGARMVGKTFGEKLKQSVVIEKQARRRRHRRGRICRGFEAGRLHAVLRGERRDGRERHAPEESVLRSAQILHPYSWVRNVGAGVGRAGELAPSSRSRS